mmetsp:Transcript_5806/g.11618  ORF Transcript_5806/g.11618 Transcript_5806/m.11618 type:complete len:209 (+) Transcript_5806:720-1346(+)
MLVRRVIIDTMTDSSSLSRRSQHALFRPSWCKGGFPGRTSVHTACVLQRRSVVFDSMLTTKSLHGINVGLRQFRTLKIRLIIGIIRLDSPFLGVPSIRTRLKVSSPKERFSTFPTSPTAIGTPSTPIGLPFSAGTGIISSSHLCIVQGFLLFLLTSVLVFFQIQGVMRRQLHPPRWNTAHANGQGLFLGHVVLFVAVFETMQTLLLVG